LHGERAGILLKSVPPIGWCIQSAQTFASSALESVSKFYGEISNKVYIPICRPFYETVKLYMLLFFFRITLSLRVNLSTIIAIRNILEKTKFTNGMDLFNFDVELKNLRTMNAQTNAFGMAQLSGRTDIVRLHLKSGLKCTFVMHSRCANEPKLIF